MPFDPATLAVHAGLDPAQPGQPVLSPLVPATSFHTTPGSVGFSAADLGGETPHFYSRWSNPTAQALESRLSALEGGEAALSFASGMAAITALFLHHLKSGDHLIVSDVCYAGVAELAQDTLQGLGIAVSPVDTASPRAVADALRPTTRLIHVETPANPILRLADISAIAGIARAHGVPLSVDSTMATPIATRPLSLGADFVVQSLTKYACGHGDALGGALIGRAEAIGALRRDGLIHLGAAINPFAAWLILRGLETLPLRMAAHEANARAVTAFLEQHPRIRRVLWPGSTSHPQHDLARRQMDNFSGMISFVTDDGPQLSRNLAERLQLIAYAVSLGKTRSLLFYIPTDDILRSSFRLGPEAARRYRDWAGEGVFRLSVGIEGVQDIIADLDRALG
jgi:cystathionine gamma-synthase/methionine-gamma-lyase